MNIKILMVGLLMAGFSASAVHSSDRFHSIEKMCVSYQMVGQLVNGTIKRCHRNYAHEWFEIRDLETGIAGITQRQNEHTIVIGDKIYAIRPAQGTGTVTQNPMYQSFKDALARSGNNIDAISQTFFNAMGFQATGETKTIAGYQCTVQSSQSIGKGCFTPDFVMLEQSFLGNTQTATKVSIGDDGGSENYDLWQKVSLSEGLDLRDGINIEDLVRQGREGTNSGGANVGAGGVPEIPAEVQDFLKKLQQQ